MRSTPDVSAEDTAGSAAERAALRSRGMLPRGAALATGSGALGQRGITAIVHAATGAMTASGGVFEPTLESVATAVANAVRLARAHGHARLAVPFVGGAIFLRRIGCAPGVLAEAIVRAAREAARDELELVFVAWSAQDAAHFRAALERATGDDAGRAARAGDGARARVVQGDLTDPGVHGASAIVNAANLEVRFGGGLSGAIAAASGAADALEAEAAAAIAAFWAAQPADA